MTIQHYLHAIAITYNNIDTMVSKIHGITMVQCPKSMETISLLCTFAYETAVFVQHSCCIDGRINS